MISFAIKAALLVALFAPSLPAVAAQAETISLDQPQPAAWGETLTFTAVFTGAEKKQFPPRIYNPVVAMSCSNGFRDALFGAKAHNMGGGWWSADFGNVIPQGSGPTTCTAWLEYTDSVGNSTVLASTSFQIGDA